MAEPWMRPDPMVPVPDLQFAPQDRPDVPPWMLRLAQGLADANIQPQQLGPGASPLASFLNGFLPSAANSFAGGVIRREQAIPMSAGNRLALARLNQQRQAEDAARREKATKDASEAAKTLAQWRNDAERKAEKAAKAAQDEEDRKYNLALRDPNSPEFKAMVQRERALAEARREPKIVTDRVIPRGTRVDEDGNVVPIGKAPSAGEREKIINDNVAIEQTANIESLLKDAFVGPVAGRVGSLKMQTGNGLLPGEADFRGALAIYRNAVINALSGAAVSESEAKRMKQQIPQETDPPPVFRAKLKETRQNLLRIARLRRQTMESTGLDLSGLPPISDDSGYQNVGGIRERVVR